MGLLICIDFLPDINKNARVFNSCSRSFAMLKKTIFSFLIITLTIFVLSSCGQKTHDVDAAVDERDHIIARTWKPVAIALRRPVTGKAQRWALVDQKDVRNSMFDCQMVGGTDTGDPSAANDHFTHSISM